VVLFDISLVLSSLNMLISETLQLLQLLYYDGSWQQVQLGGGPHHSQGQADSKLGPVFWEEKAREGQLPPILIERIGKGEDLSKCMNRHQIEIQRAIQEIVVSEKVQGRSHKTIKIYNFIISCYILGVDIARLANKQRNKLLPSVRTEFFCFLI
jgi:hypothetical protein